MGHAEPIPNHTIDPKTGFLESNAYPNAFDGQRKTAFLKLYRANGIRLRRACREMGLSEDTVSRNLRVDPVFKEAFDDVERDYLEELESTSRTNALNPRSVIERIFQLKCLMPEKYGQENRPISTHITLNVDGKTLDLISKRETVVDAEIVTETQIPAAPTVEKLRSSYTERRPLAASTETPQHHP